MRPHHKSRVAATFNSLVIDATDEVYLAISRNPDRWKNLAFAWVSDGKGGHEKVLFTDVFRTKQEKRDMSQDTWIVWSGREQDFFMSTGLKEPPAPFRGYLN
jgi:hypothetical protein